MKRQLFFNNIASAGSIFWRVIGQLILPPFLIYLWGTDRYGEWLLITSVPMFLSVTDLGFTDAASSDMTMELAKGNRAAVQRIFQSIFVLMTGISAVLCTALLALLLLDHITIGSLNFNRTEIGAGYIFILYSALLIVCRFMLGSMKAGGYYSVSTIMYDAIQFLEGMSLLVVAFSGGTLLECASVYIVIRTINVIALLIMQKRTMPWLKFGTSDVSIAEIRRLFAPAVAAMAIPLALALNFQGMVWIAGSTLGPTAAAITATVRTAARVIIQLIGIFSRAAMPIYSASFATSNHRDRRFIQQINNYLVIGLLVPGCIVFALFGQQLVLLWTHGRIHAERDFVVLMAIANLFHGIWFFRFNLLLSINRHTRFAAVLTVLTAVALAIAAPAAKAWGLDGIGGTLSVLELLTLLSLLWFWHGAIVRPGAPALELQGTQDDR